MPAADRSTPRSLKRKKRPAAPSKRVVAQAKAQERQYASQGEAVEKQARRLVRARTQREHEARDVKSAADRGRAQAFEKTDRYKRVRREVHEARKIGEAKKRLEGKPVAPGYRRELERGQMQAGSAPVLKVLEQTTRPLHGIAAGTRESVRQLKKGHGPLDPASLKAVTEAAGRGLRNKDKSTFSDVLRDVGVPKKAAVPAGFALDVAADPTTYVSFGTGSVAKRVAQSAAGSAEKRMLAKGASEVQARRMGGRAAKDAAVRAKDEKGLTVEFAGHEVPGVRRATAKAAKPLTRATRPIRVSGAGRGVRDAASEVAPGVHRSGVSAGSHEALRTATRRARSKVTQGERDATAVAQGIREGIGPKNYRRVVDAIETKTIHELEPGLAKKARALRSMTRDLSKTERRAGIAQGVVRGKVADRPQEYVPRELTPEAVAEIAKPDARGVVRGGTKPKSSKARKEKRLMSIAREEHPGRYREDIDAVYAHRVARGAKATAQAELNRAISEQGRVVKRGKPLSLAEGEAVYHIKGAQPPRKVNDRKELARATSDLVLNKKGTKVKNATPKSVGAGRYVVMPEKEMEHALNASDPQLVWQGKAGGIVGAYDKTQGAFKGLALGTPGYHVRNLVGDTAQAYTAQPGHKLPGNLKDAGRVAATISRQEQAKRTLSPVKPSGGTLKTKHYGEVPLEEAARQLIAAGAARSGFTSRELRELTASEHPGRLRRGARRVKQTRGGRFVSQAVLNREDLPRLATAIAAVRKGATWDEAAAKVAGTHYDFSELSPFERNVARRIFPFYTWSSRNIPYQSKTILKRPGKYANFQKVREEAAKAIGADEMDDDTKQLYKDLQRAGVKMHGGWERYISEWEQRNASIPVSWKGGKFTVSAALPVTDLNEFPGAALGKQLDEWYQKGMSLAGPMPKNMVEYFDNHSFFFRDQLERDYSPLVPAPEWAKALPKPLKEAAGVTDQHVDKKTGKKILAWRGKADYLFKMVPGTPQFVQQMAVKAPDAQGRSKLQKLAGWAGLKITPVDAKRIAVNSAFARVEEINRRINVIKEDPAKAKEVERLKAQRKIAQRIVYSGRSQAGYKVLPKTGAPKKRENIWSTGDGGTVKWDDQTSSVKWDG